MGGGPVGAFYVLSGELRNSVLVAGFYLPSYNTQPVRQRHSSALHNAIRRILAYHLVTCVALLVGEKLLAEYLRLSPYGVADLVKVGKEDRLSKLLQFVDFIRTGRESEAGEQRGEGRLARREVRKGGGREVGRKAG